MIQGKRALIDLKGRQFGRLTVVGRAPNEKNKETRWRCLCECGREKSVISTSLRAGNTRSCGCFHRDVVVLQKTIHGGSKDREFSIWSGIKARCFCETNQDWPSYGGRGISMCAKWRNSYPAFLADVGRRPYPEAQLDRIDNDGDYAPENVRWASPLVNNRNRRCSRNRYSTKWHEKNTAGAMSCVV